MAEHNPGEFTIFYQIVKSETEKGIVDERVLPKYAWDHFPFDVVVVNAVEFFEVHGTPIPQDVCGFLENLETGHVNMTVKERANARSVLSALRVRPGSELDIYQNHKTTDGEPFLRHDQLTSFKTICYCNAEAWTMASILWQHLESSDHVTIDAEAWYFCYLEWLEQTLEKVDRSAALPTGGARRIRASGWDEWHDYRGRHRDIFVNFIVENSV
ncbi:unnamed protein product [Heligmosomoides polygyrus]|uniref:Methyltransf_11 domain-containing protein n=1 Tax=Heligmosomoides polygyrus TaxID=6339 RepID=A0A183GDP8_HELPZ|nr:unnamed protein product [Heligmosomoides polygyrus]